MSQKPILYALTKHIALICVCVVTFTPVIVECNVLTDASAHMMHRGPETLSLVPQEITPLFHYLYQWMLRIYISMEMIFAILLFNKISWDVIVYNTFT